jgi:hypothetical protein
VTYSPISELFQDELYQYETPVVVILAKPWDTYTSQEQLLLQKILTSVKVDINGVRIITIPSLSLKSLDLFSRARVLIFGSETAEHIDLYQQTPAQGFIVIKADDLTGLDDSRKKNLWIALRSMFHV